MTKAKAPQRGPSEAQLVHLEYELTQQLVTQEARESMAGFVFATDPDYEWNWHHHTVCDKLDKVVSGEITRLIITMPPRHGKSELVSRKFPAYYMGKRPNDDVILVSYADSLSRSFNRDTQKIMKSIPYRDIFPHTYLNQVDMNTGIRPRITNTDFELPLTFGKYRSAGFMGSLTGLGADLLIIDDPIKNKEEAESDAFREKLWDEYKATLRTRVMPGGRIIICLTRWHEDDLVGRLIDKMNDPTDEHSEQWEVLSLEAIKESDHDYDPRQYGEALWPAWYPLKTLMALKSTSETDFSALFQQQPIQLTGNIVEKDWFRWYNKRDVHLPTPDFYVDSADKAKKHNDRTAILGFVRIGNDVYLTHGAAIRAKFPQRVKFIIQVVEDHGSVAGSRVWIEPKSSGPSIVQHMEEDTTLNVLEDESPTGSKETRLKAVSPRVQAGRVYLPEGEEGWTLEFIKEVCGFPKLKHDDYVDCLVGAIQKTLGGISLEMTSFNYGDH